MDYKKMYAEKLVSADTAAAALNLHSVFRVADVILHTLVEGTVL